MVAGPEEEGAAPAGSSGEVGIGSVDWLLPAANGSGEEVAFASKATCQLIWG
jgi:hypothetical protein